MFPWVCLATMPLFYPFNWPKTIRNFLKTWLLEMKSISFKLRGVKSERQRINDQIFLDEMIKIIKGSPFIVTSATLPETVNNEAAEENVNDKMDDEENKSKSETDEEDIETEDYDDIIIDDKDEGYNKMTMYLIILHILMQLFLPYSHFLTKVIIN